LPFRQKDDVVVDNVRPTFRIESQKQFLIIRVGTYNDCGGKETATGINNMRKKLYLLKITNRSNFNFLRERKTE
jgi:hypothetical protein